VPTVRHRILFVFLVLAHDRRRVLRFNVTSNPTAERTAQQIVEAFPWELSAKYLLRDRDKLSAKYLLRDRDKIYWDRFRKRVQNMGFDEILIAPRSPWGWTPSSLRATSCLTLCHTRTTVFSWDKCAQSSFETTALRLNIA
jgi:hypothetical protein